MFASDDENECHLWVMAMYRATGQSHKPTPPLTLQDKNSTISKIQGGNNIKCVDLLIYQEILLEYVRLLCAFVSLLKGLFLAGCFYTAFCGVGLEEEII